VSIAAITLCVASQRVLSVYFVIDSVRKLLVIKWGRRKWRVGGGVEKCIHNFTVDIWKGNPLGKPGCWYGWYYKCNL